MPHEQINVSHAYIRILHNIGNSGLLLSPRVDVYLGDQVVAYNLAYKDFTAYLNVPAGHHKFVIRQAGTTTIVSQGKVKFANGASYTIIIAGLLSNSSSISALVYQDSLKCPRPGSSNFRFIHAAAGLPNVDVYSGNVKIFSNVAYQQTGVPTYVEMRPGYPEISVVLVDPSAPGVPAPGVPAPGVPAYPTALNKVQIDNSYMTGGNVYTLILSLTSSQLGLQVISGIISDDNKGACEVLQENFNAQAYSGKWFQIAAIPQPYADNCPRATAEYTLLVGRIKVQNTCYAQDWTPLRTVDGCAYPPNPCQMAALRVTFFSSTGGTGLDAPTVPCPARPTVPAGSADDSPNYLVHRTDYSGYAVVGTPNRTGLWILSRNSKMAVDEYKQLVEFAKHLGYQVDQLRINYHALSRKHGHKHEDKPEYEQGGKHDHEHQGNEDEYILEDIDGKPEYGNPDQEQYEDYQLPSDHSHKGKDSSHKESGSHK